MGLQGCHTCLSVLSGETHGAVQWTGLLHLSVFPAQRGDGETRLQQATTQPITAQLLFDLMTGAAAWRRDGEECVCLQLDVFLELSQQMCYPTHTHKHTNRLTSQLLSD